MSQVLEGIVILLNCLGATSNSQVAETARCLGVSENDLDVVDLELPQFNMRGLKVAEVEAAIRERSGRPTLLLESDRFVVVAPRHPLVSAVVMFALLRISGQAPLVLNIDPRNDPPTILSYVDLAK